MKNKTTLALMAALVVIVGVLGYYLWTQLERYEEYVFSGWSEAALRNPYLAAEQLLAEHSEKVESSYEIKVLDGLSADATVIIHNANQVLTESRVEQLLQWLEQGGHIIIQAQWYDEEDPDILLSRFDITKEEVEDDYLEGFETFYDYTQRSEEELLDDKIRRDEAAENQNDKTDSESEEKDIAEQFQEAFEAGEEIRKREALKREALQKHRDVDAILRILEGNFNPDNTTYLSFDGNPYTLRADFTGSGSLEHPYFYYGEEEEYEGYKPFYWTGSEKAVSFLQLEVGEGLLTVLADTHIWRSDQIGFYDHAYLLEILTDESDQVIFLIGANVPNLFELLWQHFYELCVAVLLLLALWIIYRMRRFGVIAHENYSVRRSYREHLEAMSNYYWRQGLGEQLVAGLRKDIVTLLQRQYLLKHQGDTTQASETKVEHALLEKLAEKADINLNAAQQALTGDVPTDEIKFYLLVKLLQKIRNRL